MPSTEAVPPTGDVLPAKDAAKDDDEYTKAREYWNKLCSTSDSRTSCLSALDHSLKDARDLRSHFFGCLGYDDRVDVLDDLTHPIWTEMMEMERLDNSVPSVYDVRYISALNLQAELKRIAVLRRTPALKESVRELRDSIQRWIAGNKTKSKAQDASDCQKVDSHTLEDKQIDVTGPSGLQSEGGGQAASHQGSPVSNTEGRRRPPLIRFVSAYAEQEDILPEFSKKLQEIVKRGRLKKRQPPQDADLSTSGYDLKRDIKARLVKLKLPDTATSNANPSMANVMVPDNEPVDDEIFKGFFPDQQVSVHYLLKENFKRIDQTNLRLEEKMCPKELRYFHIPVNNMSWVEEAITSYFNENEDNTNPGDSPRLTPRTKLVLNDWCWRGQEHGGGPDSVAHNRNLRPTCEKISTDEEDLYHDHNNTQKSLVLFMPFLHWETDRRRNQAANLIEQLTDEHEWDKRETAKMWKMRRKEERRKKGQKDQMITSQVDDIVSNAPLKYKEPNYYGSRGSNSDEIFDELARMLWKKIREKPDGAVPLGLGHTLRQQIIRSEDHSNELLVALEKVVEDMEFSNVPPTLREMFLEGQGDTERFRDWRDILWRLKVAGRGRRTPQALEDIFWEAIKSSRKQAYEDKQMEGERTKSSGSFRSRQIFRKPTTIFRGVGTDEHGALQPRGLLAKVFVRAARLYEQMTTYPDQQILEEYLFKDPPLHPRRTLDQAYFWRLRNTRLRDRDQVVYRYTNAEFAHKYRPQPPADLKNERSVINTTSRSQQAEHSHGLYPPEAKEEWAWTRHGQYEEDNGCEQCDEDIRKVSRAIMVDQLWLWVLDRNTILTCFPQRYGMTEKDPSGVHQAIRMRIKMRSNPDNHVHSIFDLALIILDECFDTFFNRTKTADARPQVLDVFAESIGRVTNEQAIAFQHLWNLSGRKADSEENVGPGLLNALLDISWEASLQREIRDIIDELDIVLHIVRQQQDMIIRFVKFAKQIMDSDIAMLVDQANKTKKVSKTKESPLPAVAEMNPLQCLTQQTREFEARAEVLKLEVADRIKEVNGLKKSAESTAQNVNDLLGLKQQQAGIVQAYEAMKQGEETVRQGKAIMVFTVMTIVFLPLSFMTSVFGMNNVEESGGSDPTDPVADEIISFWPTTFKRQILIMFTVSFGAVLIVIIPAFSPFIRAVIHAALARSFAKAITWTRVYRMWLAIGWDSKRIRDKAKADVRKMKEQVKTQISARHLKQSEIWDGVRNADGEILSRSSHASETTIYADKGPMAAPNGAAKRSLSDVEKGVYK